MWLRDWLPAWRTGSMLTIDYGDTCPALYFRRQDGTLRAYAHHQRFEGGDVYAGFGTRDLTADVNFSDLQKESGLSVTTFTSLAEFISKHDISKYAVSPAKRDKAGILQSLDDAAEAFKALVQTRTILVPIS